jgi:thymidylate synthase (FAD)
MLITNGHEAMIEHSMLSVKFTVDRGVSHEIVRHRIASFAQESTRYCNYSKDKFSNTLNIIDIADGIALDTKMKNMSASEITQILIEWYKAMEDAEKHYMRMIELGATPQIARGVLPNSLKTEIVMTANYREWRNFFKLRTDIAAHPQIREVAIPLLNELKTLIPVVFDDIEVT